MSFLVFLQEKKTGKPKQNENQYYSSAKDFIKYNLSL